ncbi:LysR family transcriptional regulator [Rhodobacteraceae bacterium NNCM2]|nr:LysR family transcriptional regulator [Coraliihabitans acroporae]
MATQIRNIKSIQVFHAVSEIGNVTRAANILNISQSSVSYHIKKLETDIGVALFRRTASGLELTDEGSLLYKHVERGLGAIQTGLAQVANRAGSIRVALLPMFASRWLSPRLGSLLETHTDLQLSIHNHNNKYAYMPNPEGFADLGIQWGRGNWESFDVSRLWSEKLVVVCSPGYLEAHPIRRPEDLDACTLLHVDDTRMWEEWFAANRLQLSGSQPQMMLEDRHFQLSSTINGLGVSLFASWLVTSELANGDLVNPFGRAFETSFAYHLIVPKLDETPQPVRQFRDWFLDICADIPRAE